jgi:hypothetical protein
MRGRYGQQFAAPARLDYGVADTRDICTSRREGVAPSLFRISGLRNLIETKRFGRADSCYKRADSQASVCFSYSSSSLRPSYYCISSASCGVQGALSLLASCRCILPVTMTGSTIAEYDGECPDLEKTFEGFEEFDATFESDVFADINWPHDDGDRESTPQAQESPDAVPQLVRSVSFAPQTPWIGSTNADSMSQAATSVNKNDAHNNSRFSRHARSILRVWFNEHKDNPYPSSEEKDDLAAQTGLKRNQISLWLVNTRRRYRSRKHQQAKARNAQASQSPSMTGSSSSPSTSQDDYQTLNPMDRWKILPLENEATPAPMILAAVASAPAPSPEPFPDTNDYSASLWDYDLQSAADASNYDTFWTQSMASYETGVFSGSTISDSTALSYPYLGPNFSSTSSQSARTANGERRRRRCHITKPQKPATKQRPFHCTFGCISSFATKHDWQRHEKSQHLSLESWTCCLSGGTIETINGPVCAFCEHPEPNTAHMETHNFSECQEKDLAERTFYRKDHFQQHLRLTHGSKYIARMESWKAEVGVVKSRCGFCSASFDSWAQRADHLAAHFKCHATMSEWVGDLGFEPHIAAIVENAGVQAVQTYAPLPMGSMLPPKFPASYGNGFMGIGSGTGVAQLPALETASMDAIANLDMDISGIDSMPMGLDTTGVLDFANMDSVDWAAFGV